MTDGDVGERVRRRLRELRAERGLTLEAVVRRAAIGVSTLRRLESGPGSGCTCGRARTAVLTGR